MLSQIISKYRLYGDDLVNLLGYDSHNKNRNFITKFLFENGYYDDIVKMGNFYVTPEVSKMAQNYYYEPFYDKSNQIIEAIESDSMDKWLRSFIDENQEILLREDIIKAIKDNISTSVIAKQLNKQIENYKSSNNKKYDF